MSFIALILGVYTGEVKGYYLPPPPASAQNSNKQRIVIFDILYEIFQLFAFRPNIKKKALVVKNQIFSD